MHEAGLMVNLMRQIGDVASTERARRVTGISVWLGALCHMSVEHFIEHFERASKGTIAAGARVDVTVSDDVQAADAQSILLRSIEIET
jgi:hydrogenase nickel incorporation protein HypA/HybF